MIEKFPPFSGNIMVVDDNPTNLKLLEEMLEQKNYNVRSFPLGRLALAAAMKDQPDLILLDVNMPEMNGYEVCERLKANAELSTIPVIFLSALDKTEDKVKAFHVGAADYISKPFQLDEVQSRVETQLSLHSLQRALQLHNQRLEEAVAVRTQELAEANEQLTILDRSKNEFLRMISQEFRTPLHGLLGVSEIILEAMSPDPYSDQLRGLYQRSRQRILAALDDALLLAEIDFRGKRFGSGSIALSTVLNRAIVMATEFASFRQVALIPLGDDLGLVAGDEELLTRAVHALLETAVKFSTPGQSIHLSGEITPNSRKLIIESSGLTIPDSALLRFFDPFATTEAMTPGGDVGLRPPVASRILLLFGASVSVANLPTSDGIRFTISLKNTST
jgi:two-component system, sensor histidine kinase and response regulator